MRLSEGGCLFEGVFNPIWFGGVFLLLKWNFQNVLIIAQARDLHFSICESKYLRHFLKISFWYKCGIKFMIYLRKVVDIKFSKSTGNGKIENIDIN